MTNQSTGDAHRGAVTTTVAPRELDGEWDYPPSALQPDDCTPGQLYRVKFLDDDWDFTIPGDWPDQPVSEYHARRESTPFGTEWFVVGVSRWTYRDDDFVILGDADGQAARPEVRPDTLGFQLCWREVRHRGDHKSQDGQTWSNQ